MKTAEATQESARLAPSMRQLPANRDAVPLRSQKITRAHVERLAVVYVRQSSAHQVMENRESTARQYALVDYAGSLGWPAERVLVIDEDQGLSGASAERRSGFQRLLAEVTMDHVGMVLGLEMSRLARSSKDWHHLLELCALFGTLLGDQDGVYDPSDPNDRLLLGLRGTMSEVELHTMRNRLERGRLNKAQRGELFFSVPLGYVITPTGEVTFDPDEQSRAVVRLVFEKFEELGSARAVFLWFVQHGIRLPFRSHRGPRKGQIEWQPPRLDTFNRILHHPIYAGAYAYGRRRKNSKRRQVAGKRQQWGLLPIDQWQVLIRDRLPAYISWDQYQRNQERIKQNLPGPETLGAPRNGIALLNGLVVCGNCGWRMQVGYHSKERMHYRCQRFVAEGTDACCGMTGNTLDDLVSQQVLKALEPAAIQLSLRAQADLRRDRQRVDQHWRQKMKRARYDVELAERRYQAVDPENRLVAATLEQQWDQALRQEQDLKEQYDRHRRQERPELTTEELSQIQSLASDIAALWHSQQTTNADRQSIIRCLVDRVVLHVERNSERAEAVIHWSGGYESRVEFRRAIKTYEHLRDYDLLKKRITELWETGHSAHQTAAVLNSEGFVPINPEKVFNTSMVNQLRWKFGLRIEENDPVALSSDEWSLRDLAQHLRMPFMTLRHWADRGWVHGRRTSAQKRWIIWADQEEIARLKKLLSTSGHAGYPPELINPKPRPNPS